MAITDANTMIVSASATLVAVVAAGITIAAVHSEASARPVRANSNLATTVIVAAEEAIAAERDPIGSFIVTRCCYRSLAVLVTFAIRMSSKSFTTSSFKDLLN